jgi:hypothetical protein
MKRKQEGKNLPVFRHLVEVREGEKSTANPITGRGGL